MNARPLVAGIVLAASVAASAGAFACGDKLAMIGGGVSFERIAQTANPGSVVLLIAPDSPLYQADQQLKLADSLRRSGHTVRRVASESELESALSQQAADVVVVYWTDAAQVHDRLAATSPAPTVVPVVYRATPAQLTDANQQSTCTADVEKRRGRQLAETVERVLEQRKAGAPTCAAPAPSDQHST
jgi:hypothetical protein